MISLRTIKAMMKDEKEASEYYAKLSKKSSIPHLSLKEDMLVRERLMRISGQEAEHLEFWKNYLRETVVVRPSNRKMNI